jgi:hypothetical protein
MKNVQYVVAVVSILVSSHVSAEESSVNAGVSASGNSTFVYISSVTAANGDLSKNGFLLRSQVIYGVYDYDTTAVTTGTVDGTAFGVEFGGGYQWVNPGVRYSLYGSVDHQNHHLNPIDSGNTVGGAKIGAVIQAEVETTGLLWYGSLIGKFSSANNAYWARGRAGYTFSNITVGPEGVASGNNEYDETRYGLFVTMPVSKSLTASLSGGHRNASGDNSRADQSGGYATVNITANF